MPTRRAPDAVLKPMGTARKDKQTVVWFAEQQRYAIVEWVPALRQWVEHVGNATLEEPTGWLDVLVSNPT